MDNLTREQRHKNMKAIKSKDTSIESKFRKAVWSVGLRYRKNYSGLPGKPDIVFTKYKVAVFCDSDFWHVAPMSGLSYWGKLTYPKPSVSVK